MPGLGQPEPAVTRPWYPHLLAEDTVVWGRWLERNAHRVQGVWYDVHVGAGVEPPPDAPDWLKRVAAGVTRKRIDVVAKTPEGIWVIEVKRFGNYTALGQALVYARLFSVEYNAGLPVVPLVICAEIDTDLVDDYARHKVRFEETGYPAP